MILIVFYSRIVVCSSTVILLLILLYNVLIIRIYLPQSNHVQCFVVVSESGAMIAPNALLHAWHIRFEFTKFWLKCVLYSTFLFRILIFFLYRTCTLKGTYPFVSLFGLPCVNLMTVLRNLRRTRMSDCSIINFLGIRFSNSLLGVVDEKQLCGCLVSIELRCQISVIKCMIL